MSMNAIGNVSSNIQTGQSGGTAGSSMLKSLKEQYPHLKLSAQSFGSETALKQYASGQSGKYNVAIDPRALERMETDEEFAKGIHATLSGVKESDDWLEQQINGRSDGTKTTRMIASGTVIDKDGNVTGWAVSVSESNGGKSKDFAASKNSREELLERLAEKREERAKEAKRLEENREEAETLEVNVSVEASKQTVSAIALVTQQEAGGLDIQA